MVFAPNDADGWPNDSLLSRVQVKLLRSKTPSRNQKLSNQLRESLLFYLKSPYKGTKKKRYKTDNTKAYSWQRAAAYFWSILVSQKVLLYCSYLVMADFLLTSWSISLFYSQFTEKFSAQTFNVSLNKTATDQHFEKRIREQQRKSTLFNPGHRRAWLRIG